ncbi:MAG: DUF1343 domain-containing protein [bacterium]
MVVLTGLEVLLSKKTELLRGRRAGLVVHPASVNRSYRSTVDLLLGEPGVDVAAVFGPQHGLWGHTQDNMIEWEGFRDGGSGLPVYSLYAETRKPTPEMLEGLDVMVVDLQDVGTRVYTFASTLFLVMEACSEAGLDVVVLDRPNPVGGADMEGGLLDAGFRSFVGMMSTPMRHGMTMGELAGMYRAAGGLSCGLEVVKMEGWSRGQWFDGTGLPWVPPSPNMPTLDTAAVYPGMVLLEGTNVSEGRGTTRPFETVGAPWIAPNELADALNGRLVGAFFRPLRFQPAFHKWAGEVCGGVQVHVTDRAAFRPVRAALFLLEEIKNRWGDHFEWKRPPYEYEYEKLPIDVIAGTDELRKALDSGGEITGLYERWVEECGEFEKSRSEFLIY